jgi:hypothetical protein
MSPFNFLSLLLLLSRFPSSTASQFTGHFVGVALGGHGDDKRKHRTTNHEKADF